jgi:hypothetical protein
MYIRRHYGYKKNITILALLALLIACYPESSTSAAEDTVVAVANGIEIKKTQLDTAVATYKKKIQKNKISTKEKVQLVENLMGRALILQSESARTLRNDPVIVNKLKLFENNLVVNRYIKTYMKGKFAVSEDEIRAYYDKNIHKYETPPKVLARHILLRSRKEAEKTLADLKNGADFKQLAKERSIDLPQAFEGGEMGIITRGKCLSDLENTLFTLTVGEFSGIVKSPYGYHILKVDKIIPPAFEPFKKVEKEIKTHLVRQNIKKAFHELTSKLLNDADVKIYTERFSKTE